MDSLKIGDVVKPVFDGPDMTVEHYDPQFSNMVKCVWFTKRDDGSWVGPHRDGFAVELLKKVR